MNVVCRLADWEKDGDALRTIRQQVFVLEQSVPVELEWDEHDRSAVHFIAELTNDHGTAVATARLKIDPDSSAQIGRMAVLSEYRRQGIGRTLLRYVLDYCEQHQIHPLYLHAQVQVVNFYQNEGFYPEGEIFEDAGIPHRAMFRNYAK